MSRPLCPFLANREHRPISYSKAIFNNLLQYKQIQSHIERFSNSSGNLVETKIYTNMHKRNITTNVRNLVSLQIKMAANEDTDIVEESRQHT